MDKKLLDDIKNIRNIFVSKMESLNVPKKIYSDYWNKLLAQSNYTFPMTHAISYAMLSEKMLYLKYYYPDEFNMVILPEIENVVERIGLLVELKNKYNLCGIDINRSKSEFHIDNNNLYFPFSSVKSIHKIVSDKIVSEQPYSSILEFLYKILIPYAEIESLVFSGAFDSINPDRAEMISQVRLNKKFRCPIKKTEDNQYNMIVDKSIKFKKPNYKTLLTREYSQTEFIRDFKNRSPHNPKYKTLLLIQTYMFAGGKTCKFTDFENIYTYFSRNQNHELEANSIYYINVDQYNQIKYANKILV